MNVWLDDVRPMPTEFDVHVKTAQEAIEYIDSNTVDMISLDYDLGPKHAGTGYDVISYIEAGAYFDTIKPIEIRIHSANPVGVMRMTQCREKCVRYWNNHQVLKTINERISNGKNI